MARTRWSKINNNIDRYRYLCSGESCSLSLANLLNGKLHLTMPHGEMRHSCTFSDADMLFLMKEYFKSLNQQDKENIANYLKNQ